MPANYVLLERIELNASAASVTFSNIPQTGYTDLKIVLSARCDAANTAVKIQFNGLTTNLSSRYLYGSGSAAASYTDASNMYAYADSSSYTASTFANSEIYIPNYTSSNAKSVSVDAVTETNATGADMALFAGLWNSSAAITSVALVPNSGNFVQYSTFSLYGLAAVGTTPAIAPKASGGNITTDGTYWYHTFLASGTFTPALTLSCDYLVVGGGGGAAGNGGGAGAGGFRVAISQSLNTTGYAVTIGAGGVGVVTAGTPTKGGDSTINSFTATGGGYGGYTADENGGDGGSGGGAATTGNFYASGASGNTPSTSPSQGNNGGGNNSSFPYPGGGGGGSAAAGQTAPNSTTGGSGGAGNGSYSSWATATSTGVSGYYAGGGGGAVYASGGYTAGAGGAGGGGAGSIGTTTATSGTANTGGGGGGAGVSGTGGNGGSGIVIVRYAI